MTSLQIVLHSAWIALALLMAVAWFVRLVFVTRTSRTRFRISADSYDGPSAAAPKISVIVAAKDEADNIETCITTLLAQDYPDFEVIAVDDRSTDRTPAILAGLAETSHGKLHVHSVGELPTGWFGKNNAMRVGIEASQGEWLCLTDADCRQVSRATLSIALREAKTSGADFLSVTPVLDTVTIWEKITQPVCALALIVWFLPERVNDPNKRTAYANGAFMLLKRSCYDALGGHERVRTEVNEDIQLARIAKRKGFRLRVVENDNLYRTRMYRTIRESWRGWSRIFYGSLTSPHRIGIALCSMFVFTLLPWISLIAAAVFLADAPTEEMQRWVVAIGAWGLAVAAQQTAVWRFYRLLRMNPAWSLTYFMGSCITFGMQWNAMLKAIGATSTTWRGTTYHGHRRVSADQEAYGAGVVDSSMPRSNAAVGERLAPSIEESTGRV